MQLLEIGHRVSAGDFAAIDDTIHAVKFAAATLTVLTALINIAAYLRSATGRKS